MIRTTTAATLLAGVAATVLATATPAAATPAGPIPTFNYGTKSGEVLLSAEQIGEITDAPEMSVVGRGDELIDAKSSISPKECLSAFEPARAESFSDADPKSVTIEQLADGAAGGAERGELELGRGQEVVPPPRAGDRVEDSAGRDLGRDGEAVALVAQPGAGDGRVDRELQRVEACGGGATLTPAAMSSGIAARKASFIAFSTVSDAGAAPQLMTRSASSRGLACCAAHTARRPWPSASGSCCSSPSSTSCPGGSRAP